MPDEKIVCWRRGDDRGFVTCDAPEWWDHEISGIWPDGWARPAAQSPFIMFGDPDFGHSISAYAFSNGPGCVAAFQQRELILDLVLCNSDAMLLDMITAQGAAWLSVPAPPMGKKAAQIRVQEGAA